MKRDQQIPVLVIREPPAPVQPVRIRVLYEPGPAPRKEERLVRVVLVREDAEQSVKSEPLVGAMMGPKQ